MKKMMSMLLAFALVMSICLFGSTGIQAADTASDTVVEYPAEGGSIYFNTQTGTVTDCDESVTVADIPTSINGVRVIGIGNDAFLYCSSLTSITIPNSVTTIGEAAFRYCGSLTSVVIPDSVTAIANRAFAGCDYLTDVVIPDSITTIGEDAFAGCDNLIGIVIPDSVTTIGDFAFYCCTGLKSVVIPNSVRMIGICAFFGCEKLTNIYYKGSEEQWLNLDKDDNDFVGITVHYNVDGTVCEHSYIASVKEPNCTDTGSTTYICSECGDVYAGNALAALGHNYEEGSCRRCGKEDPLMNFGDAPVNTNWAYDGIVYCVEKGLMNGTSETAFSPDGTVSRAQLVTILYRAAGSPKIEFKGTFKDVPNGQWYSDAIEWAAAKGVVNGIGDDKFGPDQSITREQIATILYRYSGTPAVKGNLDAFPDKDSVSDFAVNALIWATQEGLINGVNSNGVTTLAPKNNATRAQIASIIMRYLEAE